MRDAVSDPEVAAVRAFNRFYTRKLGVLDQHLLQSPYSLAEARVLYELAQRDDVAAKQIGAELGLDAGYLSRIIQNFHHNGLISRAALPTDKRQHRLALTAKGRAAFAKLDRASQAEVAALLAQLPRGAAERLVAAMQSIERLLQPAATSPLATLRGPRPGDIGFVVQSHATLYAADYGFDASFEALVAEIAGKFLASYDAARERCWIAELDGEPVGSVLLVRDSDAVAKLRLLLVTPQGRGQHLGQRLVDEATGFARHCGYRTISLWTQSNLTAARNIYQQAGFELVETKPHRSFGQDLIGETWELQL
ncbi:bifunctional helix-turn-helix transcriptional regulator/GNAT family N-acetyltransferase [Rhodopseudomonas palustris]|uniref:Transcriptional regulator, MarR family with acetyltransferase activity n=1 Tax=Rhodopseudomonas palustris (strain BisB18) TaxID=316056 RepID=Q20Y99_RHOPB